jgi:UDP-N-acetyl-D-mannosaminuronic acid transferase (WecB/TagA/CpsF family)
MNEMRDRLQAKALMAGGQAFDVLTRTTQGAPELLRNRGGELMYRLVENPRRLWKR